MPAVESLTIEIQGDSSGLSQALSEALAQVESLQSAASSTSATAEGIGGHLASAAVAIQPLQQVGLQLSRISQQALALGQTPISLNVQPAMSALQSLMSAIQAIAASLSALSHPMSGLGGSPSSGPGNASSSGNTPRLATSTSAQALTLPVPQIASQESLWGLSGFQPPAIIARGNPAIATTGRFASSLPAIFESTSLGATVVRPRHVVVDPTLQSFRPTLPESRFENRSMGDVPMTAPLRVESSHHWPQSAATATETPVSSSSTINHHRGEGDCRREFPDA